MYRPPGPRSTADSRAGMQVPAAAAPPFHQFVQGWVDPEAHRSEGDLDQSGVGLMHRRVIPPTSSHRGLPEDMFSHEQEEAEEACTGAMGSGSYFTDLLGSEVQESQDLLPTIGTPIDQGQAAAKGSQGRTKNFRDEEDRLLVSAWLNVGMDPVQGVDQSQTTYWARIYEYFHSKSFESDRTQGSLNRNQSGCSIGNKIAQVCALFKAEDKKNRKFNLMHCWRILKDMPKCVERRREIGQLVVRNRRQRQTDLRHQLNPCSHMVLTMLMQQQHKMFQKDWMERRRRKKKLRQCSTIEALDYLVAKMKEVDAEKELKKEERCDKAFALQDEKIKLDREKLSSKGS
ncbi:hypothetical protein ACP70R_047264 [Stipagrostis hirtigluma subsp. patula]